MREEGHQRRARKEDRGYLPECLTAVRREGGRVECPFDGQRHGHVDADEVQDTADHPGHVEVRGEAHVGEPHRDQDRHQVGRGEQERRSGVVTGQEAAHLAVGGRDAVEGGLGVPRDQAAVDQCIDQRHGHQRREHPGQVDPQVGQARREQHQQDDLDHAEQTVFEKNPYRVAQPGEHAVLQGEHGPDDHGADEEQADDGVAEFRIRRPPPVDREQEGNGHGDRSRGADQVGPGDELLGGRSGLRDEAGEHAVEVQRGETGQQVHGRVRRRGPAHHARRVQAGHEDPVEESEDPGHPAVGDQRVAVAGEGIGHLPAHRGQVPGREGSGPGAGLRTQARAGGRRRRPAGPHRIAVPRGGGDLARRPPCPGGRARLAPAPRLPVPARRARVAGRSRGRCGATGHATRRPWWPGPGGPGRSPW